MSDATSSTYFNPPPGWPTPPDRSWRPAPGWKPDPAWPASPSGWAYWVDAQGRPTKAPPGSYGAPSTRRQVAGLGCLGLVGLVALASCVSALGSGAVSPDPAASTAASRVQAVSAPTVTVIQTVTQTVTHTAPVSTVTVTRSARARTEETPVEVATSTPELTGPPAPPEPAPLTTTTEEPPAPPTEEAPPAPVPLADLPDTPDDERASYPNCAAARAAGVAPLGVGDAGYSRALDRDGDGVACE